MTAVVDCLPKNLDQVCKTHLTNSIELFTKCLSPIKIESYCFTSNHTVAPMFRIGGKFSSEVIRV